MSAQTIIIDVDMRRVFRCDDKSKDMQLKVAKQSSLAQVKQALSALIKQQYHTVNTAELLQHAAIISDGRVLSEETQFVEDTSIAVLPPVCGG